MIISSAIKFTKDEKTFIIMGRRHHNCFETAYAAGLRKPWTDEQGFMTDKFVFVNRYEAWEIAKVSKQIFRNWGSGTLYSEDLWYGDGESEARK